LTFSGINRRCVGYLQAALCGGAPGYYWLRPDEQGRLFYFQFTFGKETISR